MLKTLKWVYDLGVRQERVRIAGHLQVRANGMRMERDIMDNMLREEFDRPKQRRGRIERLEFNKAVSHRVEEIINDIFHPKGEYIATSIMFPEGDQEGKVK